MKPVRVYTSIVNGQSVEVKVYASHTEVQKLGLTKPRFNRLRGTGGKHCARENGQFVR